MSRAIGPACLAVLFGVATLVGITVTAPGRQRLSIDGGPERDLGRVAAGEFINVEFTLRNVGDDALRIESVQGACACTEVRLARRHLRPGESATLIATVLLADGFGIDAPVRIRTDESESSEHVLRIRAVSASSAYVTVYPPYLDLRELLASGQTQFDVIVHAEEDDGIPNLRVPDIVDGFSFRSCDGPECRPIGHRTWYRWRIAVRPARERVELVIRATSVDLPIEWDRSGSKHVGLARLTIPPLDRRVFVECIPPMLLAPNESGEATLRVQAISGARLEVVSAECVPHAAGVVSVEPTSEPGVALLRVRFDGLESRQRVIVQVRTRTERGESVALVPLFRAPRA